MKVLFFLHCGVVIVDIIVNRKLEFSMVLQQMLDQGIFPR